MSYPPQCWNFQNYGHTVNYCHYPLRFSGDHSSEIGTKDKVVLPNVHFTWAIIPLTTKNVQYLKHFLNNSWKVTKFEYSIHIPSSQNSLSHSKASYASIFDSNDILLPNSHTNDKPFTKFTSELSALIIPSLRCLQPF